VFHLELRQFPHVARAFNLTREQLDARVLAPWADGQVVELDDRRWAPERAKLTIYEGRELAPEEIGMGRGWSSAGRSGEDVTDRLLAEARQRHAAPPALQEEKRRLVTRAVEGALRLDEVVGLTGSGGELVSQRVALAERAVWELLHEGRLRLVRQGATVPQEEWQPALLSWTEWTQRDDRALHLEAV
jgi:hypothetical protein